MEIFLVFIFLSTASLLSEAAFDKRDQRVFLYAREIKAKEDGMHVELKMIAPYQLEPRAGECPNPEEILPCTCVNLDMYCNNVTTEEELRSIFNKPFPQDNLSAFWMDQYYIESNITYLSPGVFGTKTFTFVSFHYINFDINLDNFDLMYATLHTIDIYKAFSLYSFVKDFSSFYGLKDIMLQETSIKDYFVQSPYVEFLTLSWSNITEVNINQSLYLGSMPRLERLWLQVGNLHIMPDISQYPKIYEYYVSGNYISYIGFEMVANSLDKFNCQLNNIQDIDVGSIKVNYGASSDFSNNQLFDLDEGKWKNILINASDVSLSDNPWQCGCEMAWIFASDPEDIPFLLKLDGAEACSNGTLFTYLDPTYYSTYC